MLGSNQGELVGERLDSWKEIARYLGREVRTVQRWARARSLPVHRLPGGGRPRVFSLKSEIDAWLRVGAQEVREDAGSLAVLPFLNLAGDAENQYFGDGLADDVINALVRLPGLRVTARTSSFAFSGRGEDVRHIGARLGVTWLLEGSIRRDRERVRVSAQLVDAHDGYHAWSECYDRQLTDIFAIQEEIACSIAAALKLKLAPARPALRQTADLAAYDLWMKGRSISQQYTLQAFAQARACYEAALARDPRFARPYFGLAELLFHGVQFGLTAQPHALPRIRESITKSLELDDLCGDAHALLGICRGLLDYDWPGAESAFRRAFELSPGSALVLIQHAWYHLVPRMRVAEALDEAQQAVALDPLSPFARGLFGLVLVAARQYARAAEECRRAVELAPGLWWLHWFYGTALLLQGKLVQGYRESRRAYEQIHQPLVVGAMALIYGLSLQRKKAKQLLSELKVISRTAYVPPLAFAFAYLGLGDDRVFEWLDKAIDARDPVVIHLPSMPYYDGIRNDARFRALLAKMQLG
jgi:excisionase family DNA binding protein